MKLKIHTIILLTAFCSSCNSWLDTVPDYALPGDKELSISSCQSLLMGAYDRMQEETYYGRNMLCVPEILADNCKERAGGTIFTDEYYNRIGSGLDIWVDAYAVIGVANYVIEGLDRLELDSDSEIKTRDQLKGEALTLRGLGHFDLLRVYAREPSYLVGGFDLGIPIITQTVTGKGSSLPPEAFPERSRVADCWIQIENDLNDAFDLLLNNSDNIFPQRASSYAAKALLARVYLYQEKWDDAIAAADWVITNSGVSIFDGSYEEIFKSGTESIFELRYTVSETLGNASLASIYSQDAENGRGYGELLFGESLLSLFETGDERFDMKRAASSTDWWTTKFSSWGGTFGQDNVPIIRISEMYLIRAEANLRKSAPDYGAARTDINAIRTERGIGATAASDADLLTALEKERRTELCFEGHRFFDLKRQGKDIPKEGEQQTIPYYDFRVVAGIPQTEIDVNQNLENNPGY